MKLLAIETSSAACSVAIAIDDEIFAFHEIAPMQQSQLILSMVENLSKSKNIAMNQLDALAFGCGPGSFTGVRIATSVAQGLAFALGLPVIPISSLAALAQTTCDAKGDKKMVVAVDARMQEIYWAAYEADTHGMVHLLGDERISKPEELSLPDDNWIGAGDAWSTYLDRVIVKPRIIHSDLTPTAHAVAKLAKEKFLSKQWVEAENVCPTYLRDSVAKKMSP